MHISLKGTQQFNNFVLQVEIDQKLLKFVVVFGKLVLAG
jgi:hypothetical protein